MAEHQRERPGAMGQCKSQGYTVEQDASPCMSPRPDPERVGKKKKGKFFRGFFSWKSKNTSNGAQQGRCRNDTVEQDVAPCMSPRPDPESVGKKKGKFFRGFFSWKSKNTSNETQQVRCKNDSVEQDAALCMSPRPDPGRVGKKKKGKFFRGAFSWKSKKTSNETQQVRCKNDSVEQDAALCMSPRPDPERVGKKKKGKFFRGAFSWKSKKTSNGAQQGQCRNGSSKQPETCSDGEQKSNTDNTSVYEWHSCVSSLTDADKDIPSNVTSLTEKDDCSASTSDNIPWKNEDKCIHLSLEGKKGDILQDYKNEFKMLGQGSYGDVFEGIRLSDSRKVALKYVNKTLFKTEILGKFLPKEVAMMVLMNDGPSVPQIIQLLDWYETPDEYILVLERPTPCEDMQQFLQRSGGKIEESTARVVMRQVVTAARICCERGVFHSDIKLQNLLINPNTLQVKLIDFGCSRLLKESGYTELSGTRIYNPPEVINHQIYYAEPTTVYSLGVLLFKMLFGKNPGPITEEVSEECRDLIYSCLAGDPADRIDLEKILLHDWFQALILN